MISIKAKNKFINIAIFMNLKSIKRVAARILKVGVSRIKINATKKEDFEELEKAANGKDVYKLIEKGIISVKPEFLKRKDKEEKKHVRKGGKYSIVDKKRQWINRIRPLRRLLKQLKEKGKIDNKTYRMLYRLAKGGYFRSRSHLLMYLEKNKLLK
ncbi:MAG: 50S ribosomal protein L19e [Candidatus Aenigmatarchaeota archaeon]